MPFVRWVILAGAIASTAAINGAGQNLQTRLSSTDRGLETVPPRAAVGTLPELLSLPEARKLSDLEEAYLDSYSILKQENSCSGFFGGPQAIEVLNQLTKQIRPVHLDQRVAFRMIGETTNMLNFRTGLRYRLFEKAEVNLNGPFYRASTVLGLTKVSRIGIFASNSREARVTLLLHELGHLIQKGDYQWLLRDDGKDIWQSEENTRRVIDACGKQIRELHKFSFQEELQLQLKARSQPATSESPKG